MGKTDRKKWVGRSVTIAFGCAVAIGVWLNAYVRPGGILEDAIVDPDDPYVQQDEEVKREFWGSDFIALIHEQPFGREAIEEYTRMRRLLEEKVPGASAGLLSLDTLPNLRFADGELFTTPYLDSARDGFVDLDHVRETLTQDPVNRRILFSEDLNRLAQILILPKGFDQSDVYWSLAEILEDRPIPWWEKLIRYSLTPTPRYESWWPVGWPLGREAISRMLPAEMSRLVSLGLLVIIAVYWLSTKDLRFSLFGTGLLIVGLIWVRGSIPLLDQLTLFRERPYIILANANTLVQGSSLVLLVSFILREQDREDRRVLIVLGAFTLLLGLGNMAALWWSFDVRAIREMAVLSGVGLVAVYVLAQLVLPQWIRTLPGEEEREGRVVRALRHGIQGMARMQMPRTALVVLLATVAAGAIMFSRIPLGSDPLEFIRGHRVYQAFQNMQDRGMWADGMWVMVRPVTRLDGAIYDPGFLRDASAFLARVEHLENTSVAGSILKTVNRLTREEFGHDVPETEEEARIIFQYIDDAPLKLGVRKTLYTPRAIRIVALQHRTNTSLDTQRFRDDIERIGAEFPRLEVLLGGQSPLYGRVDEKIWKGKLWNIATQTGWNYVGYLLVAWYLIASNRRRGNRRVAVSAHRLSLVMGMPSVFATAAALIVMAAWKIRLDQANAAYLAMANSAANDFTMYFGALYVARAQRGGDLEDARRATFRLKGEQVVTDAVLNSLCFAPLLLSAYGPIQQIGWQVPLMLWLCAFGVLFIMPPFLPWAVRVSPPGQTSGGSSRTLGGTHKEAG
ncbi:MAG: hypothetical protein HY699_19335 [Deltaproteobacteria bacterium]|nr:hypothetical protein [Deltaproteobacteria bacterium]